MNKLRNVHTHEKETEGKVFEKERGGKLKN